MPSAYIKALQKSIKDAEAAETHSGDLAARFCAWFAKLPEVSRNRPYSMSELEAALATQGRYLSRILIEHGWQRKRKWASRTQYLRYWVPPEMS